MKGSDIMIRIDSRNVTLGDTFIALKGINHDGHDYIEDAIKNGAKKIICERGEYSIPYEIVNDTREYLVSYLNNENADILEKIKFIGITGTNGKTTSAYLTYQLLNNLGIKCAYIGTIGFYYDNKLIKELENTTPEITELYEMFRDAYNHQVKVIVMEVSSHAISQGRVKGIKFDITGFTNLTQDHLDYHKTMEEYCNVKKELFKNLRDKKIAIINKDDPYYQEFIIDDNCNKTYGVEGDYALTSYRLNLEKSELVINNEYYVILNIPGKYNIYNYLLAFAIVNNLGYRVEDIIKVTPLLNAPTGRFETFKYKNNIIIVDYAHAPDGVLKIIDAVLEYKKANLYTIIGCGGDRDKKKRPIMGAIASKKSDYVIFTDDNPRTEKSEDIMNDILSGVDKDNYEVIYERDKAIQKGISLLKENDILLVLGKGHEDYQVIGNEKIHLSDREIIINIINKVK